MAVKWIRGGNTVHSEGLIAESNTTGRDVIIVGSVFGFLAVLAVGLRIWARRLVAVSLDASDWTCIAGLVVGIALLGSTVNGKLGEEHMRTTAVFR